MHIVNRKKIELGLPQIIFAPPSDLNPIPCREDDDVITYYENIIIDRSAAPSEYI